MLSIKKRIVDSENRSFKEDWTEKQVFILPKRKTKLMGLICNETMANVKSGIVKSNYETKHANFEQNYSQNMEVRATKKKKKKTKIKISSYKQNNG